MKTATSGGFPFGALLAFLGPCLAALSQSVTVPLFRTDRTVRAILEAEPLLQGSPSALLARLCTALPIGQMSGRGSLVGALAAGCAGLFVYALARDLARRHGGTSVFDPWLALTAAWSSALGAPWLTESVVLGGAAPGAALGLGLLVLGRSDFATHPRATPRMALLFGVLFGTLLAESVWAGAAVLVFLVLEPPRRWTAAAWLTALVGSAAALALWLLPLLRNASAPSGWAVSLGESFPWSLSELTGQVGIVLGIAALGAFALGWSRPHSGLGAIALVLIIDCCAPLSAESKLLTLETATSRHGLHLLSLGLWAACGSLGLRVLCEGARALGLYGASAAGPLTAVLGFTAAIAGAEDALRLQSQVPLGGARLFSDESLGALPARSIVLTHSARLTTRLLSAQTAHERPDVLIVPLDRLGEVHWMRSLVREEPRLSQLIRDLNVLGAPSEHALNLLADERPVFVEADEAWDRRLLEHLVPQPLLAGFSPHALGRSDRVLAWEARLPSLERLKASEGDDAFAQMLDSGLVGLEAALVKAGDRKFSERVAAARTGGREQPGAAFGGAPSAATKTKPAPEAVAVVR